MDVIQESSGSGGMMYNLRAWEMQCCNSNGMSAEAWYWLNVKDRTWKLAGMLLPNISTVLTEMTSVR